MKTQKKLGNKGFSLVELIVVIAIMAILVAVIAPTLLSKIEESREGTDYQTLGEVTNAVKEAIAGDEGVYTAVVKTGGSVLIVDKDCNVKDGSNATVKAIEDELKVVIKNFEFKSEAAGKSAGVIRIDVDEDGGVTGAIYAKAADATDTSKAVSTKKIKTVK